MVVERHPAKSSTTSLQHLQYWLSQAPDFQTLARIHTISPSHRSLNATTTILPHTTIVRIPPTHLISSKLARRCPHVSAVLSVVEAQNIHQRLPDALGDSAALLLFLIAELVRGVDSRYFVWFQTMPEKFGLPLVMSNELVEKCLGDSPVLPLIGTLKAELKEMYDEWFVPCAIHSYPQFYPEDKCGWDVFLYAHCIIETRAFTIDDETMLVPYADMANHAALGADVCNAKARGWIVAGNDVEASANTEVAKGLELYATEEEIEEGDDVCISYGRLNNWKLLVHYGFTLENNPEDVVDVSLEVPEEDMGGVYMKKMLFLNMGGGLDVDHVLSLAVPLPWGLVASTRLLVMDEEEIGRVVVGTDFGKVISRRNEKRVVGQLRRMLEGLRERFVERTEEVENEEEEDRVFRQFCGNYIRGQREIVGAALREVEVLGKEVLERECG